MSRSPDADPPGRNDPCRCGSGKKYKRCCLGADREAASERLKADAVAAKLSDVRSPGFALDAPTPADADRWLGPEADVRPVELDGLSLAQYARLLHYEPTVDGQALVDGAPDPATAGWAEGLARLAPRLEREPEGEAAFLLARLLEAMPAGRAIAMTRSSLLPRATVREIAGAHARAFPDSMHAPLGPIAVETDFDALHVVRLAAEDAGLLELEDGVLAQTPLGLGLAERSGLRESFPRLLRAYATVLDWAYLDDGLPEAPSVQDAWLVGLRYLARHGAVEEGVEAVRLGRALALACAEAVHEIHVETNAPEAREDGFDGSPEEAESLATTAFTWRLLVRFAELFGLATLVRPDGGPRVAPDGEPHLDRLAVRATGQLARVVAFDPALLEGLPTGPGDALPDGPERDGDAGEGDVAAGARGAAPDAGPATEPEADPPPAVERGDEGGAEGAGGCADDGRRRRSARAATAAERRRRRR